MNVKIINCKFDRKTNKTTFYFEINNHQIPLSFDSNPLLEVDILESHQQPIYKFLKKLLFIIENELYNYKTLENLKNFYNELNKNTELKLV
jgi:hypothetical protein